MKRLITFLLLIFVFSISFASGSPATASNLEGVPAVSKLVSHNSFKWTDKIRLEIVRPNALLTFFPVVAHNIIVVQTKFLIPEPRLKVVAPRKTHTLIGRRNINCYGGTCARYARG